MINSTQQSILRGYSAEKRKEIEQNEIDKARALKTAQEIESEIQKLKIQLKEIEEGFGVEQWN